MKRKELWPPPPPPRVFPRISLFSFFLILLPFSVCKLASQVGIARKEQISQETSFYFLQAGTAGQVGIIVLLLAGSTSQVSYTASNRTALLVYAPSSYVGIYLCVCTYVRIAARLGRYSFCFHPNCVFSFGQRDRGKKLCSTFVFLQNGFFFVFR